MNTTPKWYLPVVILALLWNMAGCAAYLKDVMLTPEDVAKLSAEMQALYAARPAWSVAATAIAVWAGLAGCIGLIMRKRWAAPVLIASLAASWSRTCTCSGSTVVRWPRWSPVRSSCRASCC